MTTSFKPEVAQPTAIPGQMLSGGTAVWHYNCVMNYAHDIDTNSKCKLNKNLSYHSPTTSTLAPANVDHSYSDKQITPKFNHMRISLDYPLCSSLLNDHLFHADFYSGLGPYTINTEWLV